MTALPSDVYVRFGPEGAAEVTALVRLTAPATSTATYTTTPRRSCK